MPRLETLLREDIIHVMRSDGSKVLAMQVRDGIQEVLWEVLTVDKDGMITLDVDK